jgi:mono/diheme cytochrome c family protein
MATGSRPYLRTFAWLVGIACLAFVVIQFVRPELTHPPATADLQAPPEVKQIFKTSCYNCHSNETALSWFDEPVPAYWLVVKDVNEARKHVNFSEIGNLPAGQQRAILYEAFFQIERGEMPLPQYMRLHPNAAVKPEQLAILRKYLTPPAHNEQSTSAEISAADAQYDKWIQQGAAAHASVPPAPNGFAFLPDYKNWKAISSTERFDNHTIRQVLGNDVAVKAIAESHINPWPDGAAFAKVAWFEQTDGKGIVRPGQFFQVEFMLRDAKKYAATLGWGWGRWRGAELKPYGKDAAFTEECVGCHKPLGDTNYVFTEPIRGQQ